MTNSDSRTALAEYVKEADKETHIGQLCWYSLNDVAVPYDTLTKALGGYPDLTLPNRPNDHDVFRRVSSKQKASRVPADKKGQYYNYLLREFSDSRHITRRVVRETVDTKGERLRYIEMIDVVFTRPAKDGESGKVSIRWIPGVQPDSQSIQIAQGTLNEYASKRGTINAQGVREWIRRYLVETGSISVKPSGGLYFVPEDKSGALAIIEVLSDTMNQTMGAGTIDYHSLPLVDNSRQREMIRRAFEADTSQAIDTMMVDVGNLLKDGTKISEKRYADLLGEYQRLIGRTTEYQEVLDNSLQETETRVQWFKLQIEALLGQVKHDTKE